MSNKISAKESLARKFSAFASDLTDEESALFGAAVVAHVSEAEVSGFDFDFAPGGNDFLNTIATLGPQKVLGRTVKGQAEQHGRPHPHAGIFPSSRV